MPLNTDLNLLFIHIPRTSGKTFEKMILKFDECHKTDYEKITGDVMLNGKNYMSSQHFNYRLLNKYFTDKIKEAIKISIVRNPIDRIISIYFCENYKRDLNKKNIIRFYYDHFEVDNFIEFLETVKKNLNSNKPYFFWESQYDYLKDENNNLNIDHILKFENMPSNFDFLNLKDNINNYMNENNSESKIINLKEYNINFIKKNPGSIDLIYEIYKKDFDSFNYDIKDYFK